MTRHRDIRGLIPRKDLQRTYPPTLAVGIPPILYDHVSWLTKKKKEKKRGKTRASEARRGINKLDPLFIRV